MKTMQRITTVAFALLVAALPFAAVAQPQTSDYQGGWGSSQPSHSDRWDRDRWDGDHGRDEWRDQRWREGPVYVRNSRSRSAIIQLRDSRGVTRSSFTLAPGERRTVRTSANSRWSITVRHYKYYRKYSLSELGSFDDGRWYVRIR